MEYVIKLLKQNVHVFLEQDEAYKSVAQKILKHDNIDCYAKFINEKYKDKYTLDKPHYRYKWKDNVKLNTRMTCFHPTFLNYISTDNKYCINHQQKNYDF